MGLTGHRADSAEVWQYMVTVRVLIEASLKFLEILAVLYVCFQYLGELPARHGPILIIYLGSLLNSCEGIVAGYCERAASRRGHVRENHRLALCDRPCALLRSDLEYDSTISGASVECRAIEIDFPIVNQCGA
jgi:hypothetical protein